ncbi:MAG: ABC transporter ATP-binding protein [Chloroflexi bacterium]|nr:ABC transporter ATP-binding protein [Chloroflexota bacterium]
MAFLEVKDVEAYYGKAQALNGITFSVEKGECIGIIGPNGAGKSTLLDSIIGLTDWRGQIIFDGTDLHQLTSVQIIGVKKIGYAPERGNLFRFMNVMENLLVGGFTVRNAMDKNLETVFELFSLLEQRQKQEAGTLSGGERQMLSLARAFMSSPKLMLLDEPTLGLAPIVISHISAAVENLKKLGITIIIAEQNALFTLTHSERIYLLERGRFTMSGTPRELREEEYIKKTYFGL